jgi:uncharacterized protein YPO0396
MMYQNYVVRAIRPDRWKNPAIGQRAIQQRLGAVKIEIDALTAQTGFCASVKTGFDTTKNLEAFSSSEIEQTLTSAKNIAVIEELEMDLISLRKNRDAIDTSAIDSLRKRIADLSNSIAEKDEQLRESDRQNGCLEERQRSLRDVTIPNLKRELLEQESKLELSFIAEWVVETGKPRYEKELAGRGKAESIAAAFPREQSRVRNIKESAWEKLQDLRRSYNEKYKMGFDVNAIDNSLYVNTWEELSENKLPDYQTRIDDAKKKAFEQFQEDFISRLQNNINNAKWQINEINDAIKWTSFGEDTYRFRIIPKPEYKRYYDMIVDDMITLGGYNLWSAQFNDKYRTEIADLFAIITNEDGAGGSFEYERRVHEFTDFRNYLSFDLVVLGPDGEEERLSKTIGKKSGGETQTPFYIAVLASFAQLYRTGRDKTYRTSRLIIFDEAFSKMDSERIVKSIALLRKLDFQAILSAPTDKISDIATLVDRNLCVIREEKQVCVRRFDPRDAEFYMDES